MIEVETGTARAWVDVDVAALVANARTVQAHARVPLLPMVKANGYGLGAVPVARALEAVAPWGFGVATTDEAAALRRAGILRPIVVFTPLAPWTVDACLAAEARPAIGDLAALDAWRARAGGRPFHVELDTGMGRAGFRADEPALLDALAQRLAGADGLEGLFTHFHSADHDRASVAAQLARFDAARRRLPRAPLVHAANSAAALRHPEAAFDLVRPGIFVYGGDAGAAVAPRAVARVRARVVAARCVPAGASVGYDARWRAASPTEVATLAIGYGDGVPRALANAGRVALDDGREGTMVGTLSMDMVTIVVDGPPPAPGEAVTVLGGPVPLDAQAARAGTISYDLLVALGSRLPRRYLDGGRVQ